MGVSQIRAAYHRARDNFILLGSAGKHSQKGIKEIFRAGRPKRGIGGVGNRAGTHTRSRHGPLLSRWRAAEFEGGSRQVPGCFRPARQPPGFAVLGQGDGEPARGRGRGFRGCPWFSTPAQYPVNGADAAGYEPSAQPRGDASAPGEGRSRMTGDFNGRTPEED